MHDEKYLTFVLKNEEFAINILKVKEIIGMQTITEVPKTPEFIKGVINLRGKVIPIMDLRLKFEMEEKVYNEKTCIVVVEREGKEKVDLVGVAVDTVSEVVNIEQSEIAPPPSYSSEKQNGFINGMGKLKEKVVMLLDIDTVIGNKQLYIPNEI